MPQKTEKISEIWVDETPIVDIIDDLEEQFAVKACIQGAIAKVFDDINENSDIYINDETDIGVLNICSYGGYSQDEAGNSFVDIFVELSADDISQQITDGIGTNGESDEIQGIDRAEDWAQRFENIARQIREKAERRIAYCQRAAA
jgi:hypothetical protein